MNIDIGRSGTALNHLTKSFTNVKTCSAQIKENTSIVDPVFIVSTFSNVASCNYVKCATWGRNYYIKDITALTGDRVAISCHCDVLASFAGEIRGCGALVDKQQYDAKSSKYINDGSYVMECDTVVQSYNFPYSFDSETTILITAGGNA